MAGIGPPPKNPDRRARGARGDQLRVIDAGTCEQPELPEGIDWPVRTVEWWRKWREEWPLSGEFSSLDWEYLLDTALLHARFWSGETKLGPEIRLRVANFGVSPADRARLRITFAQADEADEKRSKAPKRERRVLTALPASG